MNFTNASIRQKEDYLEELILGILRRCGGEVTSSEMREKLLEENEDVARYAQEEKMSEKTGRFYSPFDQNYSFAKKNLMIAGFLSYTRNGPVILTEKGKKVDLVNFDPGKDVWPIAKKYWEQKQKEAMARRRL